MKNCFICNHKSTKIIYNEKIRDGSFGKFSKRKYSIKKCNKCNFAWLHPSINIDYNKKEYRKKYNKTEKINSYFIDHDYLQNELISKIGIEKFRNKTVLDFGCGGGSFLDLISNVSKKTYGIEPFKEYHKSLELD